MKIPFIDSLINKKNKKSNIDLQSAQYLEVDILYRPTVPIQYVKNCNDNLYISNTIEAYLKQYYFLLYIPFKKDASNISFIIDCYTHYENLYLISLMDLIDLIYNYHTIDLIASLSMVLDQFHILKDKEDYSNKIKILNMLTENISCINTRETQKIFSNVFLHNIPDIDKIYYDYKSYLGMIRDIPDYLMMIQVRHENISYDDYIFIKNLANQITVDSFKNLDNLNIQYTISFKAINDNTGILLNSIFNYLTQIDNLHYLSKFKNTIERNSIFKEIQDLDEDVDEIIEESELQDNEK